MGEWERGEWERGEWERGEGRGERGDWERGEWGEGRMGKGERGERGEGRGSPNTDSAKLPPAPAFQQGQGLLLLHFRPGASLASALARLGAAATRRAPRPDLRVSGRDVSQSLTVTISHQ